ncbi:MAG: uracil-DNA glycosylase [Kurthia sp.]|nr:uracil-DNA glycosylase [Candidatus Kurthia equi]
MLQVDLPKSWQEVLSSTMAEPYFQKLMAFVENAYKTKEIFPPKQEMWNAFKSTAFENVKVVILGQDPYHDNGQAHGLSFSVKDGVKIPPSLKNMYKELADDLQIEEPSSGNLQCWANQGVLLLNTVLTVEAHQAHSHKNQGWESFTDEVIRQLSNREQPMIFVLWGKPAQQKKKLIDATKHRIIENVHPSPLSAYRGFFGSKPYSQINAQLEEWGQEKIQFNCQQQGQMTLHF